MLLKGFSKAFSTVGMVHIRALPGTPLAQLSVQQLVDRACDEAQLYGKFEVDAVLVENMFDLPYVKRSHAGPELTAVMTRVATEVRRVLPSRIQCGIQILAGQNHEAMAAALAANLQFIRAEGFVFGHVGDEGYIESCAGSLLRYRKQIGAENVSVWCDIKKKHSAHSITADVGIGDTAKAAQFFLSDALILTGKETGDSPVEEEISQVRASVPTMPIILGSGVTEKNVVNLAKRGANGAIVGSHFKLNGLWQNELCPERIEKFMNKVTNL